MVEGSFAEKKSIEIKGRRMAYLDEGEGAPIVFQHGNPTKALTSGARSCRPASASAG